MEMLELIAFILQFLGGISLLAVTITKVKALWLPAIFSWLFASIVLAISGDLSASVICFALLTITIRLMMTEFPANRKGA